MLQIRILNSQASELEKYLNRDYWEQRETQDLVSAGQAKTNIMMASGAGSPVPRVNQEVMQGSNPDSRALEVELNEFTETLRSQGRERVREVNIIKDYFLFFISRLVLLKEVLATKLTFSAGPPLHLLINSVL